jgi:predicted double-glycine peptidase
VAQERSWRVRSLAEIRQEGVIIQRWDASCGAAALATLLTYDLGDPVAERTIATAMLHRTDPIRVRARGGFSLLNMQEYAQARGYEAEGYGTMSFDDLIGVLPAIVPVSFHGYDHFAVGQFERSWEQKVAFVVRRRDR